MESRRSGRAENGHANGSQWQNDNDEESITNDLLQYREDPSLQGPNMGVIKRETFERTRSAMAVSIVNIGVVVKSPSYFPTKIRLFIKLLPTFRRLELFIYVLFLCTLE